MGFFSRKVKQLTKVRKQVLVDENLYNKLKGRMYAQGKTFSNWLTQKMEEELDEGSTVEHN